MATAAQKDTIYIDVDDEITTIIDKVESSASKVVALVLPKRAVVLQSIVNMRLLKRAAADSNKNVVLITNENGLLPIAGAVGMYTAKTLQSKPEIPSPPDENQASSEEDAVEMDGGQETVPAKMPDPEETVEVGDDKPSAVAAKSAKKKNKNPKVPNFEKFRKKLFIAIGAVIALLLIWYFAVFAAGSANVTITTQTEPFNTDVTFTASTTATTPSTSDGIVPAKVAKVSKQDSQTAKATGEKDASTKAGGSVTVENCQTSGPQTLPAGSNFTASNGKVFVSNAAAAITPAGVSGAEVACGKTNVAVTAAGTGESYNIGATSYTNPSLAGDYSITGSAMSGGSTKTITVVSKSDVDNAKGNLNTSTENIATELATQLEQQGQFAIKDSLQASNEKTTVTPEVGQEASEVKVDYSADFTMLGINRDDLKAILMESIKDQVDTEKQQIQDDGLNQATFTIKDRNSDGTAEITVSTVVAVGPKINTDQLKSDIAGKKKGEATNIIKTLPGVQEAEVKYSPFWISKAPNNPNKISIEFKEAE